MEDDAQRPPDDAPSHDEEIRTLLRRLARRHRSGGVVIERAAVLAEGGDFDAIMEWILARGGAPEETVSAPSARHGLHGSRLQSSGSSDARTPARFVLPAGALD